MLHSTPPYNELSKSTKVFISPPNMLDIAKRPSLPMGCKVRKNRFKVGLASKFKSVLQGLDCLFPSLRKTSLFQKKIRQFRVELS